MTRELVCTFKLPIFSKFFGDLMSHIIREYAGKKIKWFLNVSPLTIMNILLWPFMAISLYLQSGFPISCFVSIPNIYFMVLNNSAARLFIFKVFSLPTRLIWTYTVINFSKIFPPTCLLSTIVYSFFSFLNTFYGYFSLQLIQYAIALLYFHYLITV